MDLLIWIDSSDPTVHPLPCAFTAKQLWILNVYLLLQEVCYYRD